MASLTSVILCGGAGVRLWPVSRELYPKQFLALTGERTMLQETMARAVAASDVRPIVICNAEQRFIVAEQLRDMGRQARIVLEPERRDSGPAIAVAAEMAVRRDPDSLLLVLPSDHSLPDGAAFAEAVMTARRAAEAGFIVTFGITPDRPATEFGYIRLGEPTGAGPALKVTRFTEKPKTAEAAQQEIDAGALWNSGMFLFRARDFLEDLAVFEPEMAEAASGAVEGMTPLYDFERLGEEDFRSSPSKSVDFAVMERTKRAAVLPVSFVWSDVGNWAALWDNSRRDENGNAAVGPVEIHRARGSYVRSDKILTTLVGLDDVIVVATEDAVLVAAKSEAQNVKDLVGALKLKSRAEVTAHTGLFRPWGLQQSVDSGPGFAVKRLVIRPGEKISLQRHARRSEHWVVVRGSILATLGDEVRLVRERESAFVPVGLAHRIANPGSEPVEVIEVRTGDYLGEDDVERLEDLYGRAEPVRSMT